MNIVVDTNVLVSAVLWKGPPFQALKIILEKHSLVQRYVNTGSGQANRLNSIVCKRGFGWGLYRLF